MVASGALRRQGGAVIDALFKSTMLKLSRNCPKRSNSSKYVTNELVCDLAFTLGRGRCLREVLQLFGISERVVPKVNLMTPHLPQSYVPLVTCYVSAHVANI